MFIGIVEGFYGKPWAWDVRYEYSDFLSANNLNFYLYAPKDDVFLREKWKEKYPSNIFKKLKDLSEIYHRKELKWGIALSPYELYLSFNKDSKYIVKDKIAELESLNPDVLAILFDDMKGDIPNLAALQIEIINYIKENTNIVKLMFCPSYYSFDPMLDRLFGKRPKYYLEEIGKGIDKNIEIIWTGPLIKSQEITVKHIEKISSIIGRKPFIWDNLICNDMERYKYLYIKPIEGREKNIKEKISGYMLNPMLQPELSKITIITLGHFFNDKYYNPKSSFKKAVAEICGEQYAQHILNFQKDFQKGLNALSDSKKKEIKNYFTNIDKNTKCATEIIDWLNIKDYKNNEE